MSKPKVYGGSIELVVLGLLAALVVVLAMPLFAGVVPDSVQDSTPQTQAAAD